MKKSLKQKITIGITAAMLATPFGMNAAPQTAEAGFSVGSIIGGIAQGAIQTSKINKMVHYINDTEEGRNEFFEAMQDKYGVNTDWELNQRLDTIMANMTTAIGSVDSTIYDKPYLYFINQDDSFNAFCTYGHVMSVNQGLFAVLDNDAEVAVVLGHEMGHGQKDHPAKGAKKSVFASALATAADSWIGNLAATQLDSKGFSVPMEKEADNLAFEYITHSNYNPGATAAVWQRVDERFKTTALGATFSDHSSNKKRRNNYEKKLEEYSGNHVSVTEEGVVQVNGQFFCTPAPSGSMSSHERAFFVQGNLAAAYHNGHNTSDATVDGTTVMLGAQPVITCTSGDEDAQTLCDRLNKIKDGKAKK
ncbi:M48 family metallopeptidase [uncultured Selenomonas sp.]|uniref:M48 family metallopeptidase n=1 Tax=uncultured Selenomonas sp. TaxID=159275 RepID=UPI0025DA80D7|nr:M48 family metallopeptidase [uncultured Selenomonas sp.]